MKVKDFREILKKGLIFIFSIFFCYFASVKEIYYAYVFLFLAFFLFETLKKDELFLLKIISAFYVIPFAFYNKILGISALVFAVLLFSVLWILRHVKKIDGKKIGRVFFLVVFVGYFFAGIF